MQIREAIRRLLLICAVVSGFALAPTAAAAAPPPLSVYGKLPGFERAALSASGARVAMIATVGEQRMLVVVDVGGGVVAKVSLGDIKVRGLYWAGDGMVLIHSSNTTDLYGFTAAKTELSSMTVIPLDSMKPWSVFAGNSTITGGIRGFYGVVERGGKWFGYFGGITLDRSASDDGVLVSTRPILYEVDLQTQRERKIAPRYDDGMREWVVGPDGTVSATLDYMTSSGGWTIRNRDRQKIASGVNKLGGIDLVGFGQAPDSLIYSETDVDDGEIHWYELPLIGGVAAREILSDTDISQSYFDNHTRQLAGYAIEGDVPSYKFFDAHQQKVINATLKAFPGLSVKLEDWNGAFDRLLVKTEGVGDPQTWWVVDIKTGKASILGTSYAVRADDVAPMKMIRYKATDGTEIDGVLTLPPGRPAKNLPVIIFPHGGPTARDYPDFDWWAQAFASRGYAVLQPNFRGSSGYGAAFEHAGHGEWGRKMQSDISDGLTQLVKDGIADPKRTCIMGGSYGGYAALAGVTLQQGLYRCAVSVAGIGDVAKMVATDLSESARDHTLSRALKDEVGSGRNLVIISPIRFASKADAPVLLIHGKDDTVVNYDQSNDMAAALRRAGKTVEFVTLPHEDHWLSTGKTRLLMLETAVAFVEKYNPADPGK